MQTAAEHNENRWEIRHDFVIVAFFGALVARIPLSHIHTVQWTSPVGDTGLENHYR